MTDKDYLDMKDSILNHRDIVDRDIAKFMALSEEEKNEVRRKNTLLIERLRNGIS